VMGGGPFSGGYELKKTGARSARARTRGQNPLVMVIIISNTEETEKMNVKNGMDRKEGRRGNG
jgi:hypothetical protein